MRMPFCLLAFVIALTTIEAVTLYADDPKPRVLMLTESKGFVHQPVKRLEGELSPSEVAMRQLAIESGKFTLELSQDAATSITRENLQNFDVVMFYTSGDLTITNENMDYFVNDWLKKPKHGMVGVHSSTDTLKKDPRYFELIGGSFAGHPWGQNTNVVIKVHEPSHPTVAALGEKIELKEEIYQYTNWVPSNVRVLMSLDMANCEVIRPSHVPVAWVKSWGEGRLYYNNMGHRPDTWQNPKFMQSMLAGILWAAGRTEGPTAPNPELSAHEETLAKKAAAAAGVTEESLAAEAAVKAKAKEKAKQKAKAQ
jgi:type 1 glutamine amidotransferase